MHGFEMGRNLEGEVTCLSCRRENQLMVSDWLCLDCFQLLPHEPEEIVCQDWDSWGGGAEGDNSENVENDIPLD